MKEKAMHGKPHVRFDEGGVAAATPMRGSLLYITFAVNAFCAVLCAQGAEMPVLQFRIEGRHTESDEAWAKTFGMLKECPGLCDEVWFGTGFGMPTLEKHREYAARIGRASKDVA